MNRPHPLTTLLDGLGSVVLLALIVSAFWQFERLASGGAGSACTQRGFLDTAGTIDLSADGLELSGWGYDKGGLLGIKVVSEGRVIAHMESPVGRPDVAQALHSCAGVERAGFSIHVPSSAIPPVGGTLEVQAHSRLLGVWRLGTVDVAARKPFGQLDAQPVIRWNGPNHVSGWVLSASVDEPPRIQIKHQDGRVIVEGKAHLPRPDVGALFGRWPHAHASGFDFRLSMSDLPRGDYTIGVEAATRDEAVRIGTLSVENSDVLGFVEAGQRVLIDPEDVDVYVFLLAERGDIERVQLRAETGELILPLAMIAADASAEPAPAALRVRGEELGVSEPLVFHGRLDSTQRPAGTWRLTASVEARGGRITVIPGPIVRSGGQRGAPCAAEPLRLFFPGGNYALVSGFPELSEQRALIDGGCVEVGLRARVEYLRSTRGQAQDYAFDPDLPDALRVWRGKEMTGVSLKRLLETARALDVPLLVTLDGGVWADSAFSIPEFDVVDMLEQDPATVQWNQHGRAEEDHALDGLAGSIDSPELARMMSLNRFNVRFLEYKKRNLQAAVREIVRFMDAHPDRYIAISLDPDQYINPWFYLEQWYDYNPDTLRQYREWLFHLGPYADEGEWVAERSQRKLDLRDASRLAGRAFNTIDEVEPPRGAIDYDDDWQQLWTQFKRHLVARHYEDLARWARDAGMPAERIFTGQTFIQTDVAGSVFERARGWTDQAGVSILGAAPEHGRLGAILYGPASRNHGVPRSGVSLIDNIRVADARWGSSEFHPATIEEPQRIPDHEASYLTVLEMTNGGARMLSPMWGSRGSDQLLEPGRFRAYDAYERTPFETQLVWLLQARQTVAAGDMLFPYGNPLVSSLDRWQPAAETQALPMKGQVVLEGASVGFESPEWEGFLMDGGVSVTVRGEWGDGSVELMATLDVDGQRRAYRAECRKGPDATFCMLPARPAGALRSVRLEWSGVHRVVVDEVRIERRTSTGS